MLKQSYERFCFLTVSKEEKFDKNIKGKNELTEEYGF